MTRLNTRAASGNRTPDLRITSHKQEVQGVVTSPHRVRRCVAGSVADHSLGCSIGCSAAQDLLTRPTSRLARSTRLRGTPRHRDYQGVAGCAPGSVLGPQSEGPS
jgi:hypothetical protein